MKDKQPYVVCFGEVLWDVFPEGKRAGGAPFNVAYNVHKMGFDTKVLSKIGKDDLGQRLIQQIGNWGISTEYIQIDDRYPTSTVIAKIDEHNEATYEIIDNVAWDHIELDPNHNELITSAEAFVFGSLSSRNEETKNTLFQLLEMAKLKVFDVNLRPPFIDIELIKILLHKSDIVKINKSELHQIIDFIGEKFNTEEQAVQLIQNHFDIGEVILTKGSEGAIYFVQDQHYAFPALPISIADTVGSGDSFLSGFISKRIQKGTTPEEILSQAIALGAFITSKPGACPEYEYFEFEKFKENFI